MMTTTLNRIREHNPCREGWTRLLKYLGKTQANDEPLGLDVILASNGLDDALWCLCAIREQDVAIQCFALACARRVEHLAYDQCVRQCNNITEQYCSGKVGEEDLYEARSAARDAALAALRKTDWDVARDSALAALWAARAAAQAATVWELPWAAAWAARAAAEEAAEYNWQEAHFRKLIKR